MRTSATNKVSCASATYSALSKTTRPSYLNMLQQLIYVDCAVTFCSLNPAMVKAFAAVGSQLIDKLKFRDLWAFVGQQGIVGMSPIEQVS